MLCPDCAKLSIPPRNRLSGKRVIFLTLAHTLMENAEVVDNSRAGLSQGRNPSHNDEIYDSYLVHDMRGFLTGGD
jgi:hypothetical protein